MLKQALPLLLLAATLPAQTPARMIAKPIQNPDFRGTLYLPTQAPPKSTAILLIGGSEGHLYLADEIAPQLSALGYPVLAVDYHDGFDPGRKLDLVPIETFTHAIAWLKSDSLHPARIAVLGDSRGSEAALLTAIYSPDVSAVLAFVPSSALWGATDNSDTTHHAAWSWQSKPLPCANCFTSGTFTQILDHLSPADPALIPVERIHAPIFLAASEEDATWPSARMARDLAQRLKAANFTYPVTLLIYPHSSHQLLGTGPKDPIATYQYAGKTYTMNSGGTAAGTEDARNQSWAAMLHFLATIP